MVSVCLYAFCFYITLTRKLAIFSKMVTCEIFEIMCNLHFAIIFIRMAVATNSTFHITVLCISVSVI